MRGQSSERQSHRFGHSLLTALCIEAVAADKSSTRDRSHRAQVSKMKTWAHVCCVNGECSYQESESCSGPVPLECAVFGKMCVLLHQGPC